MLIDILAVLKAILADIEDDNKSITIVDDMHFIDNLSGVEFHLYDEYFQMTRGKEKPVAVSSFTKEEHSVIMEIKELITPPDISRGKKEDYHKYLVDNRTRFSDWYTNPIPTNPVVVKEEAVQPYIRRSEVPSNNP